MIGSSTGNPNVVFHGGEEASEEVNHFPPYFDNYNILPHDVHDGHDIYTISPFSVYNFLLLVMKCSRWVDWILSDHTEPQKGKRWIIEDSDIKKTLLC